MFAMPDAAELVELAASLNIRMSEKEAELYLPLVFDAMRDLDAFVQSRAEEAAPPMLFPERGPGYRPSLSEDCYQAWLWKCSFGGGAGLLAGKSVSFKDHISVAGIPRVYTSQALPAVRNIAPLVEQDPADRMAAIEADLRRNWMLMPIAYNTKPTNYTGHPAVAVPCGKVDGMPISLQLVRNFLSDPLLLRVAYAFQRAVDWAAITGLE